MLGGLVAAFLVARELPFLSSSGPLSSATPGRADRGGARSVRRGPRRPLRPRRAHQAGGTGPGLGLPGRLRHPVSSSPTPAATCSRSTMPRASSSPGARRRDINAVNMVDGLDGLAAGVVGVGALAFFTFCYSLTRLNGTPAGDHGGVPQHRPGRGLHRVPRAQLPPGPAVHGRQRLDADRAGPLGERGDPVRPVLPRAAQPG